MSDVQADSMNKDHIYLRIHIWVRGRVQGVGFRAFVEFQARQLDLTGWVRNVGWDTVEVIAEGSQTQIDRLVEAVRNGPSASRVTDCRTETETATGEFHDFEIRSSR